MLTQKDDYLSALIVKIGRINLWIVDLGVSDHDRLIFLKKGEFEVRKFFKNFNSMIQMKFQTKIQVLKADNAKEFFETVLGEYLKSQGVLHQYSCVNTYQQNGVVARKK